MQNRKFNLLLLFVLMAVLSACVPNLIVDPGSRPSEAAPTTTASYAASPAEVFNAALQQATQASGWNVTANDADNLYIRVEQTRTSSRSSDEFLVVNVSTGPGNGATVAVTYSDAGSQLARQIFTTLSERFRRIS